ncbi:hypothetical protein BDV95DRAFT_102237 [Massariosphaeria phaeospora]|uniref:DUF6594 domain-containing protein n=1 Tax=Massariosphaeria phaeospora TaxID=100035 RepID=A0A7C8I6K9_9PLEO|nr:hypothetical protein BDV95DRAFT_102237 [Massariosphaeria phaeospora]
MNAAFDSYWEGRGRVLCCFLFFVLTCRIISAMDAAAGAPPSRDQTPSQQLLSLVNHHDLFAQIGNRHPEADIRQRLYRPRAIVAGYVEGKVCAKERAYDELAEELRKNPHDEGCFQRLERGILELDEALEWNSRVLLRDSQAANAPGVDPFFLNVFRDHLNADPTKALAPNGEPRSMYGSHGDPVSDNFASLRDCPDDIFRRLILDRLLHPFNQHIVVRCLRYYNKLLSRSVQEPRGLAGQTLDNMVHALECLVAALSLSGSVILLYNISSMRDRLIAATFLSLAFLYPITFLSREATRVFALTAAFWAVIIVFITYDSRRG